MVLMKIYFSRIRREVGWYIGTSVSEKLSVSILMLVQKVFGLMPLMSGVNETRFSGVNGNTNEILVM